MTGAAADAALRQDPGVLAVDLGDPRASDPALTGSKAACLATAGRAGLPVIEGFAVTTVAHAAYLRAGRVLPLAVADGVREAWARLSRDGTVALVVRSSSTVEDVGASSMAGQFRSVLDVRGWDAFLVALASVLASADEVPGVAEPSPLGVLVQRHLDADRGGVMFGIDPVTGDARHLVLEAVTGGPDALVSGRVSAQQYVVARSGRLLSVDHRPVHVLDAHERRTHLLRDREVRALARLAARTRTTFGGAQDVEWAFERDGRLVLLQSRPVTATGTAVDAVGPVLGPGPVGETFPDPLGPLEVDLWIGPLREGLVEALRQTRAVPSSRLGLSPVVTTVEGRVAADLQLFGYVREHGPMALLDPRPALRRLAVSWSVGRVRATLEDDAARTCRAVDDWLAGVDLLALAEPELLDLLDRAVDELRTLHRTEVLAGTLLPRSTRTAAACALEVLAAHPDRSEGEDALLRRFPVLLALVPPVMGGAVRLPPAPRRAPAEGDRSAPGPREQVRLRARWVHELTVRGAWRLGVLLAARGLLDHPASVALLDRAELRALLAGAQPPDLHARRAAVVSSVFSPPLPAQFRLTAAGAVVPASRTGARPAAGTGAGGGRGVGPVVHGTVRRPPQPGDVLVVRELAPALAAWLPDVAGLVAETGGTLSHLAILAREYGVPTVVGVHDALVRFPAGSRVVVDGSTGEVSLVDEPDQPGTPGGVPVTQDEEVGG